MFFIHLLILCYSDQQSYASHNSTPSVANASGGLLTRRFLQTQRPQIDANVLNDIEIEAQYLAASVDNLMENLCNLLHSVSKFQVFKLFFCNIGCLDIFYYC